MSHTSYKSAKTRLQRSELAVPGSSPKMFEKALNSDADYIFLDLEDAVSPNDKITARANVIKALKEINWREKGKTISVRINSLDTHYMYSDLVELVEQAGENIDTILVPKAGTESDVYMVDCMLTQIETNKKIILAYEPVWSIGTGLIPSSEELSKSIKFIKSKLGKKSPKVLYGGSVNSKNIDQLKIIPDIDGFLIGGASQNPKKFIDIIKKTIN